MEKKRGSEHPVGNAGLYVFDKIYSAGILKKWKINSMNENPSPEILHQPKILDSKKMYLKL